MTVNLTPSGLLSSLRSMNRMNLRSTAMIQEELSFDASGGASGKRWVERFPKSLKCRVSAPGATDQETLLASKIDAKQAVTVTFEYNADVRLTDRFVITQENGTIIIAYPVGNSPRDVEVLRKFVCEVRQ